VVWGVVEYLHVLEGYGWGGDRRPGWGYDLWGKTVRCGGEFMGILIISSRAFTCKLVDVPNILNFEIIQKWGRKETGIENMQTESLHQFILS
jgi:hypothetical protein